MLTIQYDTTLHGVPVRAILQVSGDPAGNLQVVAASVNAAGLGWFGILKAKAAGMISQALTTHGFRSTQTGSTVIAVMPDIHIEP